MSESVGLTPYLNTLQKLPFVRQVEMGSRQGRELISLSTPEGIFQYEASLKASTSTSQLVERLKGGLERGELPKLLLAPLVGEALGAALREAGVEYVDSAGNCYLNLQQRYIALIVGGSLKLEPRAPGLRSAGYRLLFALIAEPSLAGATLRRAAERANVSRTAVASLVKQLETERYIIGVGERRRLVVDEALLDRWCVGYRDILRPALWLRSYRMPEGGRAALERRLTQLLPDRFSWGGAVAAALLGGTYAGEGALLHLLHPEALPLTPDPEGAVHVLSVPGPLAWPGSSVWDGGGVQAVHPLLIYAELRRLRDDRAQEAALEVRDRFLAGSLQ